jgi:thymidylate kinase
VSWLARYRSVALVGIDGSGKSTQSKLLRRLLDEGPDKARVFVVHPFGRKLLRVGVSSPLLQSSSDSKRLAKRPRLLHRLVAVADIMDVAIYLWLVRVRGAFATLFSDREVWVVGDRSMDDILVKHQRQGTLSSKTGALIRSLVPEFQVTIWLEVAPHVAMARDNDFELDHYEELYEAYSAAAKRFGWRVVREGSRGPEGVRARIVEELVQTDPNPDARKYLQMVL